MSREVINVVHPRVKSIPVCGCALFTSNGLVGTGHMPVAGEE